MEDSKSSLYMLKTMIVDEAYKQDWTAKEIDKLINVLICLVHIDTSGPLRGLEPDQVELDGKDRFTLMSAEIPRTLAVGYRTPVNAR